MAQLAHAGARFFVCPDNTAHEALELPGDDLALPGLHIAEVVASQAAHDGRIRECDWPTDACSVPVVTASEVDAERRFQPACCTAFEPGKLRPSEARRVPVR